jgi:hypothetical protein
MDLFLPYDFLIILAYIIRNILTPLLIELKMKCHEKK